MIQEVLGSTTDDGQSDADELSLDDGEVGEVHAGADEPAPPKGQPKASAPRSVRTDSSVRPEHRQEYDPASKIPPQRWNQVLDERNSLRAAVNKLKQESQRQPSAQVLEQKGDSVDQEIDRILRGGGQAEVPSDPIARQLQHLEIRQARLDAAEEARAVRDEASKLQSEVAEVQKRYPFIDKNLLFQAVAKSEDPDNVDLWEVAERWESLMEQEFTRRAKVRGMTDLAAKKDAKQQMQKIAEAPRPKASGSSDAADYTRESVNLADPKQRLAFAKQLAAGTIR